ncbi:hypothetical protein GCM10018790_55730 [Kitasatospora xanthocidica]|uniref:transposase n=1 Tax=Kitasatospora xanthocidica TaxID=83382 RepID=UPI0016739703|nr:transposase [Kitasatospora xanthocidica]GHF70782.1 hypothetical protein GCM10018790_55730 [Kitasatospora xanthocidica]
MPGRKRHIVVDCLGLLLAVMVTAANVTDREAALPLLECVRARYRRIVLVWADGGYAGRLVGWAKQQLGLSLWRSSSAATTPQGSWCRPDAGWWNAR